MTTLIKTKLDALSIEELANVITHGLGLFLSIIGFVVLTVISLSRGDVLSIVSCTVYGASLVILYGASTFYHSSTSHRLKKNMQVVDHCCIYLLIAGSYTPFGMMILGDSFGRWLMIGIWTFAILGCLAKLVIRDRFPAVNVVSYLIMGWLGVFAIQPLLNAIGEAPVALAIAGGITYTLGVVFFPWKSIRHHHAIFHVFILLGSIIHYAAVVLYIV